MASFTMAPFNASSTNVTNFTPTTSAPLFGCSFGPLSRPFVIVLTIAYCVVIVVSLIANVRVIRYAASRNKMQRSFDRLIVNMAVADILDALLGIPCNIVYFYVKLRWFPGLFGQLLCKTMYFGMNLSITASGFTFAAIAVDRYFAIAHRAKRSLSQRTVKFSIALIWIIAGMVFSSDYHRFRVLRSPNGEFLCLQDGTTWGNKAIKIDTVVKFILNYGFPLCAMVVLYGIIIRYLWRRNFAGYASDDIERKVHEQRRNSVKKLMTIVVVFALCWLPVHVISFIAAFRKDLFYCTSVYVPLTCIWLAHSNCAINPCLYLYLSRRNRSTLAKPSNTF